MRNGEPLVVVCAADDRYAMPLAVMVRSLIDNLEGGRNLILFVLDGGIEARSKRRLLASWDLRGVEIVWEDHLHSRVAHLTVWERFGASIYFRLLIPEILPPNIHRAVYLDSDLLVLDDLGGIWETDLRGQPLGAVQDWALPRIGHALPDSIGLGLSPEAKYFNSGVLLMDLDLWRAEQIGHKALGFIDQHRHWIRWPDQDALNAVLAGRWIELERRWNVFLEDFGNYAWQNVSIANDQWLSIVERTGILHFAAVTKPWRPDCLHPRRHLFFEYLDRTSWAGWRPERGVPVRPHPPPLHW